MDIMVKGDGKKFYKPDQVVLSINFFVNEKSYEKALEKGTKSVEVFVEEVLGKLSVDRENLKTRNFRISQNIRFDYQTKKQIDCGFDYSQSATLKIDYDMKKIANFINEVSQLDNPPKYNMMFSIKDQENAKKEVMNEAYNKAKEKAEVIALSAGKKLKDCVKVDFRPFDGNIYSNSRLSDTDLFESEQAIGSAYMKQKQATADVIQNTFTPEDVEISETLYCLWIAE